MKSRSNKLIALAGVIALVTALFIRGQLSPDEAQASLGEAKTRILVASSDIPPGSFIRGSSHLEWIEWPEESLHETYLLEGKVERENYSGAVVRRHVMKGEPVTEQLLVHADEGGFMAAVLAPGKRAISIPVDSTSGNAGFIFPGDKVDLILTHSIPVEGNGRQRQEDVLASETFIEDVRVLAVDQKLDNPENEAILAKTVTLEVARDQAEKINVAKDLGKISLSLRSLAKDDHESKTAATNGVQHLRQATRDSDVSSVLVPRSQENVQRVVVIRGSERNELQF